MFVAISGHICLHFAQKTKEELVRIVGSLLAGDREEQFKMQKAELMP
jgi:hypothetical protein